MQSDSTVMQCGCFCWPADIRQAFEFFNSVAEPVVANSRCLTIKMSKVCVVGVALLDTCSSGITFFFFLTSPVHRLKFSIRLSEGRELPWVQLDTDAHTPMAISVLTQQRCCSSSSGSHRRTCLHPFT